MNAMEKALVRWSYPFVFGTWTFFLLYLLVSQRYVAFLRPEFGILLAIAHFIAMGFTFAAMIRMDAVKIDMSAILRALVLLVPVFYSIVLPDTMLGSIAFKNRFTGPANNTIGRLGPGTPPPPESRFNPGVSSTPGELSGNPQEVPQERTILDVFLNPEFYIGQRVVIKGMFLRDEKLKPHFGGRDIAVYRFLINCCVADAVPLAIALNSDSAGAFDNDQWVQVEGIFDLQQIDGKPVPMVSEPRIKAIEAPAFAYLF